MKSRNFVAVAVAALTLGISSAAFAQGPMQRVIRAEAAAVQHVDDRRGDRDDFRKDRRDDRRDHRADRREHRKDHRADRREVDVTTAPIAAMTAAISATATTSQPLSSSTITTTRAAPSSDAATTFRVNTATASMWW